MNEGLGYISLSVPNSSCMIIRCSHHHVTNLRLINNTVYIVVVTLQLFTINLKKYSVVILSFSLRLI